MNIIEFFSRIGLQHSWFSWSMRKIHYGHSSLKDQRVTQKTPFSDGLDNSLVNMGRRMDSAALLGFINAVSHCLLHNIAANLLITKDMKSPRKIFIMEYIIFWDVLLHM